MSFSNQTRRRFSSVVFVACAWAAWAVPSFGDYDDTSVEAGTHARVITRGADTTARAEGATFDGMFSSKSLTLKLRRAGGGNGVSMYLGTLSIEGTDYLVTATQKGDALTGTFGVINAKPAEQFKFTAALKGETLTLTSDKQNFSLQRQAAGKANPLTHAKPPKSDPPDDPRVKPVQPDDGGPDDPGFTEEPNTHKPGDITIELVNPDDGNPHGEAIDVRPPQPRQDPAVVTGRSGGTAAQRAAAAAARAKAQIDEIERLRAIVIKNADGKAAVQLGDLFANADNGIQPNPLEACIWYSVADDLDDATAAAKNQAMSDRLTEAQLAKVDARAESIMKEIKAGRGAQVGRKPSVDQPGPTTVVIPRPPTTLMEKPTVTVKPPVISKPTSPEKPIDRPIVPPVGPTITSDNEPRLPGPGGE